MRTEAQKESRRKYEAVQKVKLPRNVTKKPIKLQVDVLKQKNAVKKFLYPQLEKQQELNGLKITQLIPLPNVLYVGL